MTVFGETSADKAKRVPVISFTVKGIKSKSVVEQIEKKSAIGCREGHMYSYRLLEEIMGFEDVADGVVRVSLVHYNTGELLLPRRMLYAYEGGFRG